MAGEPRPWDELHELLVAADLVVSATGATEPIVTAADFRPIVAERYQRPLLILDLAIPRDFDPAIGELTGVYLYSIDDLQAACEKNRREREQEWPRAERIIEEETRRFMADLHHRATAPTIKRLKSRAEEVKADELARLFNKLGPVDREDAERDHGGVRPAGQQAAAPAAGIAARRGAARRAARAAGGAEAAVSAE